MKSKPVIGISSNYVRMKYKAVTCEKNALGPEYVDAVLQAGGIPVIIPILDSNESIREVLKHVDGLLMTGGDDIHPKRYGQKKHRKTSVLPTRREQHDFMIMRAALDASLPTLAICCGIQLLNVACGGTLLQDIPSLAPQSQNHRLLGNTAYHRVNIMPKTLLRKIIGKTSLVTNSMHHQALLDVGKGLKICAKCEDGIIEGVEFDGKRFFLGVQWHPEELPDRADHRVLFKAFIDAV